MRNLQEKWRMKQNDILDFVMKRKKEENKKKKESRDLEERYKYNKITMVLGIIYLLVGGILLSIFFSDKDLLALLPGGIVIGFELVVLGAYASLYSLLFVSEYKKWEEKCMRKRIKKLMVFLFFPYYECGRLWKGFIKQKRQEHVIHLFPYYLFSFLLVAITFAPIYVWVNNLENIEYYKEGLTFIIVAFLLGEFFLFGRLFAKRITKSVIKSVQKDKVKKTSKKNWRGTINDSVHKQERNEKFEKEWIVVKEELQYTKIYFYIILNVLILCIPKGNDILSQLFFNQFIGITSIAALLREVKSKTEEEKTYER